VPPVRINPDVPAEVERMVNKALEKDRDIRCQSAAELRADLKRVKRGKESNRTVAASATPDQTLKRGKLWVILAACIAVIGLAAIGFWHLRSSKVAQIDSIAVLRPD